MNKFIETQYQQAVATDIQIDLPAVSELLLAINDEISNAQPDISKISVLIAKDISLSKSVLWLINSPMYRLPRQITDIRLAVTLLGVDKIRTAVYMPALNSALAIKPGISELLWKISILKAICAAKFVEYIDIVEADDAYIAGLFSNSGQLVFAQQKDDYQRLLQQAVDTGKPVTELEQQHYVVNSSFLAFKLSELWKLPVPVMAAILLQDIEQYSVLEDERIRGLIAILIASNYCIVEMLQAEPLADLVFHENVAQFEYALEELALSKDYFEEIKVEIHDELLKTVDEVLGY